MQQLPVVCTKLLSSKPKPDALGLWCPREQNTDQSSRQKLFFSPATIPPLQSRIQRGPLGKVLSSLRKEEIRSMLALD